MAWAHHKIGHTPLMVGHLDLPVFPCYTWTSAPSLSQEELRPARSLCEEPLGLTTGCRLRSQAQRGPPGENSWWSVGQVV